MNNVFATLTGNKAVVRVSWQEKIERTRARTHGTFRRGGEWVIDLMSKRFWAPFQSGKLKKKVLLCYSLRQPR